MSNGDLCIDATDLTNLHKYTEELDKSVVKLNSDFGNLLKEVNSGKSIIAASITNAGLETDASSTFEVMGNKIGVMAGNQYNAGYLAGKQDVTDNLDITYVRHYHTGSPTSGGGCYTVHNIHHHTGSPTSGGGCYLTPQYRDDPVYGVCPGHWVQDKKYWGDKDGNGDRRYYGKCSYCGKSYDSYSDWDSYPPEVGRTHTSQKPTSYNKVLTGYALSCGYTEGQDLGYKLGCGYEDGQILSATIKY